MESFLPVKDEEDYYDEAATWDQDASTNCRKKIKYSLFAGGVGLFFGGMTMLILIAISPYINKVVPVIIEVDKKTGQVEVREHLISHNISEDEAISKYFITKYLNAREQFDWHDVKKNYALIAIMSTKKVFSAFYIDFDKSNPNSPLNKYTENDSVEITIKDIKFLNHNERCDNCDITAYVQLKKTFNKIQSRAHSYQAVTLSFKYHKTPDKQNEQIVNPLGFQVTAYRNDDVIGELIIDDIKQSKE